MPQNKKNKREEKRRQVAFLLRQNEKQQSLSGAVVSQDPLSEDLAAEYFQYITMNNISKFGIVKLHRFMLNSAYSTVMVLPNQTLQFTTVPCVTLMAYANILKRDKIMAALVRCGADPSVYYGVKSLSTFDVTSALNDLPPSYCVWLIRKLYGMVRIALAAVESETVMSESICKEHSEDIAMETPESMEFKCKCNTCSSEEGTASDCCLLTWDCGHTLCWECSWRAACRPLARTQHAFRCPVPDCGQRCDGGNDDFFCSLSSSSLLSEGEWKSCCDKRKQDSYQKWIQLPASLTDYDSSPGDEGSNPLPRSCPKKPVLKAQPFHMVTAQFLGTVQQQRVLELHKASAHGDTYRLHALLEEGVNVEGMNEYGQTALFVACMQNQPMSVRYLLWAGAAVNLVDNSGCGVMRAVSSNLSTSPHEKETILILLKGAVETIDQIMEDQLQELNLQQGSSTQTSLDVKSSSTPDMTITTLIPPDMDHLGAGACYIDNCFTEEFLTFLDTKYEKCPVSPPSKLSCSSRSYYCDTDGKVRKAFATVLTNARGQLSSSTEELMGSDDATTTGSSSAIGHATHSLSSVFPFMRYLCYSSPGGSLPPHEDLSRSDHHCSPVITSTHTFIIYLTTCMHGGETNLLYSLSNNNTYTNDNTKSGDGNRVLARVAPVRGRLLLFPHRCPHEGAPTESLPKLLLRGEAF
jgi:hypothetical protein